MRRTIVLAIALFAVLPPATASATTTNFSSASNGQHVAFDPGSDALVFDDLSITAGAVLVTPVGDDLAFSTPDKTVYLDDVGIDELSTTNVQFANGSVLITGDGTADVLADAYGRAYDLQATTVGQQVWGLGGADVVRTGSGPDLLVGTLALPSPLDHVSQVGGTGAPTATHFPTVSADGRRVAFEGGWTSFGSGSNSATDVLVKDLVADTVSNEHENSGGTDGNSGSGSPAISADGTKLAFLSASSNLVGGSPSGALYDIYVADVGGNGIVRASTGTGGTLAADGRSLNPEISANGRYVVFEADVSNWAAGGSTATYDIFLKDLISGTLTRISTSLTSGDGNGDSINARISPDGRWVVFQSAASNLTTGDANGRIDVFLWDRNAPGTLANLTEAANPSDDSVLPDVAADDAGATVTFETARSLVAADTNATGDVYAIDPTTLTVDLVSAKANGTGVALSSGEATISGDGRFVSFTSFSDALVPGDTNGTRDILIKDRDTGAIVLVSHKADGTASNQASTRAEIAASGDFVVFESSATNLAPNDGNGGFTDVFRAANPLAVDQLLGGPGDDTYVLAADDVVTEAASAGHDTIGSPITRTLPANVEDLVLTGSSAINGTGNGLDNALLGNSAPNRLTGNGGDDTLDGGPGNGDIFVGGTGDDTYVPDVGDSITENPAAGTDTVRTAVNWTLLSTLENLTLTGTNPVLGNGNAANNVITGNSAPNTLSGNAGNDTLDGGPGNGDVLKGGTGNDTYVTDVGDSITENPAAGTDTVRTAVNWTLLSTLENLTLTGTDPVLGNGNAANNVVTGNSAGNALGGVGGNDRLNGGGGTDTLTGGPGTDTVRGGAAADVVVLSSAVGTDKVLDLQHGVDAVRVARSTLPIGNADAVVDGAVTRTAPGGYSRNAELVVFTRNAPGLTPAQAAAAIGSATSPFPAGARRLFVVDTGHRTGIFRFVSSAANASVAPAELTLLATLEGTANTTPSDYVFG